MELRCLYPMGKYYTVVKAPYDRCIALQKHSYSNIYETLPPKTENFQIKNSDIFHISAQNTVCGYLQGSSNENPQSMFSSRNKKTNV